MNQKSSLVMWGERGMIATMLIDFSASARDEGWSSFLDAFNFADPSLRNKEVRSALVIVEPDFSNQGFGHPDAILRFDGTAGDSTVAILEAKRLPYAKCCAPPSTRGGAGFNSTLNGQLELNHCLALALSSFTEGQQELVEPEWVLYSPYRSDRQGKLRALKNRVVIEEVAKPFSGIPIRNIFHLVITLDDHDPFENPENEPLWPEIFHPDYPFQNCWKQLRVQFAWTSWDKLEAALRRLAGDGKLGADSLFLPTFEKNRRNFKASPAAQFEADRPAESEIAVEEGWGSEPSKPIPFTPAPTSGRGKRGATMIYAPSINRRTFLHFSWLDESCAIRDYSQSPNIMPLEDRQRRKADVLSEIKKEVFIRNRRPISDTKYWYETTTNLNKMELPALLQR